MITSCGLSKHTSLVGTVHPPVYFAGLKAQLWHTECYADECGLACLIWCAGYWFNLKRKNIRKHSVRDALPLRRGLNFQHIHICFKLLEKKKKETEKSTVSVEILYNQNVLNVSEWGIPWQASSLHGGKETFSCMRESWELMWALGYELP